MQHVFIATVNIKNVFSAFVAKNLTVFKLCMLMVALRGQKHCRLRKLDLPDRLDQILTPQ